MKVVSTADISWARVSIEVSASLPFAHDFQITVNHINGGSNFNAVPLSSNCILYLFDLRLSIVDIPAGVFYLHLDAGKIHVQGLILASTSAMLMFKISYNTSDLVLRIIRR